MLKVETLKQRVILISYFFANLLMDLLKKDLRRMGDIGLKISQPVPFGIERIFGDLAFIAYDQFNVPSSDGESVQG